MNLAFLVLLQKKKSFTTISAHWASSTSKRLFIQLFLRLLINVFTSCNHICNSK